jgi:hypothetical protein
MSPEAVCVCSVSPLGHWLAHRFAGVTTRFLKAVPSAARIEHSAAIQNQIQQSRGLPMVAGELILEPARYYQLNGGRLGRTGRGMLATDDSTVRAMPMFWIGLRRDLKGRSADPAPPRCGTRRLQRSGPRAQAR